MGATPVLLAVLRPAELHYQPAAGAADQALHPAGMYRGDRAGLPPVDHRVPTAEVLLTPLQQRGEANGSARTPPEGPQACSYVDPTGRQHLHAQPYRAPRVAAERARVAGGRAAGTRAGVIAALCEYGSGEGRRRCAGRPGDQQLPALLIDHRAGDRRGLGTCSATARRVRLASLYRRCPCLAALRGVQHPRAEYRGRADRAPRRWVVSAGPAVQRGRPARDTAPGLGISVDECT